MKKNESLRKIERLLDRLFNWFEDNTLLGLLILILINITTRLIFLGGANYFSYGALLLRVDGYVYMLKSLEMLRGDWVPMTTHASGWSFLLMPFLYFIQHKSLFEIMALSNFFSIFISSLTIIPLYLVSKEIFQTKKSALITLVIFTSFYWSIYSSLGLLTEPIFGILLLFVIYFLFKYKKDPRYLIIASILAGICYWIRPNGIFVLAIILITLWFLRKKVAHFRYHHLTQSISIFFITAFPFLYQRYLNFGSPFYYGENSKYFVDEYHKLWGTAYPNVSFFEYLSTHSLIEIFNRFVVFGFGNLIFSSLAITLPFSIFLVWGIVRFLKDQRFSILLITLGVWIISLVPIYAIYFTPRHLFPILPIASILIAAGVLSLVKYFHYKNIILLIMAVTGACFISVAFFYPQYYFLTKNPKEAILTARWIAENVRGKIAVAGGNDLIMIHLPDTTVSGRSLFTLKAPRTGLEIVYPGHINDIDQLTRWLKENNVDYVSINRDYTHRIIPPLKISTIKELPYYYEKIYHDYSVESSWETEIYKLNWSRFK
jgi:hypothetical protein